jgi:serine protease Do
VTSLATRLLAGGAVFCSFACALSVTPGFDAASRHQPRLLSDLIPHSMMPSSELPLVNILTEKIPQGLTERGTSFPIGGNLWMSARHVVNDECNRIIMIIHGQNVDARIKYLDADADLAVLEAEMPAPGPTLPIGSDDPEADDPAYAFGFPQGTLGATADQYLGRTRLKLGGLLSGTAPVLAWTEMDRYPADFDSLAGISGGPMINGKGYVLGDIVAASVRRGRNYTVAPEVLRNAATQVGASGNSAQVTPAADVVAAPVVIDKSASMMDKTARVALTYCIPE